MTAASLVLNAGVLIQLSFRLAVLPSSLKSKRLRVLDEFEDEDSVADVMATVTQYLSVNEEPSDELRADPLLYWRNSRFVGLASLAKIAEQLAHIQFRVKACFQFQACCSMVADRPWPHTHSTVLFSFMTILTSSEEKTNVSVACSVKCQFRVLS